jgi:hypothetical protein
MFGRGDMYSVFDDFLGRETWSSLHTLDLRVFNEALGTVVDDPEFSPEAMGDYMRKAKNPNYHHAIATLVNNAWAVKEFLAATRR